MNDRVKTAVHSTRNEIPKQREVKENKLRLFDEKTDVSLYQ